jgi:multiple sugar transport system ATP-binding protein
VQLRVDVVEVLGSDQYLYGKLGDDDVIARVDPQHAIAHGDLVTLAIDQARMHLFDAKTEAVVF